MLDQDILNKIKLIKIQTRRRLASLSVGQYRASYHGHGLEFDQIRDYEIGDDIRYIDWKGSARAQKLLIKQYIHEYSKTILICVDVSFSTEYGSENCPKKHILAQIATVLAFAAEYDNAQIGLVLFSDIIEEFVPPKVGPNHMRMVIEKLWKIRSKHKKTNISTLLSFLDLLKRKDSIMFILSDFIDQSDFIKDIRILNKKYELVAIRCLDKREKNFSLGAFLHMVDSETGQTLFIDGRFSSDVDLFIKQRAAKQTTDLKKSGIPLLDIDPEKDFMKDLIAFCAYRIAR